MKYLYAFLLVNYFTALIGLCGIFSQRKENKLQGQWVHFNMFQNNKNCATTTKKKKKKRSYLNSITKKVNGIITRIFKMLHEYISIISWDK